MVDATLDITHQCGRKGLLRVQKEHIELFQAFAKLDLVQNSKLVKILEPYPSLTIKDCETLRVGNTHELIDNDVDKHKWTMFVQCPNEPSKVVFQLHADYSPSTITLQKPPFEVTRSGYAEFEVKVKILWANGCTKDVVHRLNFTQPLTSTTVDLQLSFKQVQSNLEPCNNFQTPNVPKELHNSEIEPHQLTPTNKKRVSKDVMVHTYVNQSLPTAQEVPAAEGIRQSIEDDEVESVHEDDTDYAVTPAPPDDLLSVVTDNSHSSEDQQSEVQQSEDDASPISANKQGHSVAANNQGHSVAANKQGHPIKRKHHEIAPPSEQGWGF